MSDFRGFGLQEGQMGRWETLVELGDGQGAVGGRSGELSGLGRQKLGGTPRGSL